MSKWCWALINDNDTLAIGWNQVGSNWYFFETESNGNKGVMYAGVTVTISEKSYTFNFDGCMLDNYALVSDNCITFVKSYEGFSATKYDDSTGVITQGYGCIGDEIADWGYEITEQQASDSRQKKFLCYYPYFFHFYDTI
jgi:lysozyme